MIARCRSWGVTKAAPKCCSSFGLRALVHDDCDGIVETHGAGTFPYKEATFRGDVGPVELGEMEEKMATERGDVDEAASTAPLERI